MYVYIPRKQVQNCPKKFLQNKNNKKRFLGEATGHNDHCMINKGGQRQNIVRNDH